MRKSFGIFKGFSLNYVGFQSFARKAPSLMNLMNDKKANDFVDKFFENKENAAFTKQFDSFLEKKEAQGLNLEAEFEKIMQKTKGKGGELNMNLETLFKGEDFQQLKKKFVETMSKMNKDDTEFQEMQDFIKSSPKNKEELPIVEVEPIPKNQKKISDKEEQQKQSPKKGPKEQKTILREPKQMTKEQNQKTQEKAKSNEKKKKSNK